MRCDLSLLEDNIEAWYIENNQSPISLHSLNYDKKYLNFINQMEKWDQHARSRWTFLQMQSANLTKNKATLLKLLCKN